MREIVADVTYFYRWGPREAGALTWTELSFWLVQARRIAKTQQTDSHG